MWARNGKELFYRNGEKMMVVPVETEPTFKAERPRVLFEGSYRYGYTNMTSNYDVTADGQRFVMLRLDTTQPASSGVVLVVNWFTELHERMGTN